MSDTPRTEYAFEGDRRVWISPEVMWLDDAKAFACTLERELAAALAREARLREALETYQRAYPHSPPHDCFATGPCTGDPIQDFIACPGCHADKCARAALSTTSAEVKG